MTDLDRLLSESLKETGSSYAPPDALAAREEFVARRRRKHIWQLSGGVVVAVGLAAVLFFASAVPLNPDEIQPGPMKPAALSILSRFEVGTEPLSIAAGGDRRLWIASREGDSVSRIDLDSGLVDKIDLPGANEIVVDDENVWVSGETGNYLRIDEDMPEDISVERSGSGQVVDLAVGGHPRGATWAVDTEGCIWELTTPGGGCNADENVPTDVATDNDETWILASEQGHAWFFDGDPASQEGRPGQNYSDLPTSEYGDMTMTDDTLWVSGGGRIVTVDLGTGERRELEVDGDYADLALGPDTVWALAGWANGDDRGRVYELSHDLEVIGISDVLRGEPSDLVADANGVWITIRHRNEVMYLSRGETVPPIPPALEEGLAEPLGPNDLVMVFSGAEGRKGETYAMYGDGRTELITASREAYLYPHFVDALYSDGPALLVEHRDLETLASDLLYLDVPTGETTELVPGSLPSVASTGQVAYWAMEQENPRLFITEIGTDFRDEIPLNGLPNSIEWDGKGRFVYVDQSAGHEDWRLIAYDSRGETGPFELDPGDNARYLAASAREPDSLHLIRMGWPSGTAPMVGSIALVEMPWATFDPGRSTEIVNLYGLGIDERALLPENLRLQATGRLDAVVADDGTIRWGVGDERSWILGFRTNSWLVKESGEIVDLGEFASGGIAVSPELLER